MFAHGLLRRRGHVRGAVRNLEHVRVPERELVQLALFKPPTLNLSMNTIGSTTSGKYMSVYEHMNAFSNLARSEDEAQHKFKPASRDVYVSGLLSALRA